MTKRRKKSRSQKTKSPKKTTKSRALKLLDHYYSLIPQLGGWFARHVNLIILLVISVLLLGLAFTETPQRRGDGNEYYGMLFSLGNHGSPELRDSDIADFFKFRSRDAKSSTTFEGDIRGKVSPSSGYYQSKSGKQFSIHFWLYSLSAVPAKIFLQVIGSDQLIAFQVTNALFIIFSLAAVLFFSGFSKYKKWLFSALVLFSPAVWYLGWPHPEVFSCSLVVASIGLFTGRRHALAILCAALAATQNPPIIVLMLFYLLYGSVDILHRRKFVDIVPLLAASLPAFVPMLFYYVLFDTPNLIYKVGGSSLDMISFSRTFSIFFDLNQGIFLFIPGIFIYFLFLLFRNWRMKEWRIYELLLLIVLMVLLAETTTNLNTEAEGIMRYAVWIIPLFIWGIVEGANLSFKTDRFFLIAVLIIQLVVGLSFRSWVVPQTDRLGTTASFLKHNAVASFVFENYPYLYNPEPEIFAERTLNAEISYFDNLPILYSRSDGYVTKIMTDINGLEVLGRYEGMSPDLFQKEGERHLGDNGIFYINLSPGEMRFISQDKPLSEPSANIQVEGQDEKIDRDTKKQMMVKIINTGSETWYMQGMYPISLSYHIYNQDLKAMEFDNVFVRIPHRIKQGEEVVLFIDIKAPAQPGVYYLEFDMMQEKVAWFKDQGDMSAIVRIEVR